MRTPLLTLFVAAALSLTACNDTSPSAGHDPVVVPTPKATSTGNPFGDTPANRTEPTPTAERDQAVIQPMIYSLDPCKMLAAAGTRPGDFQSGDRRCRGDYTSKPRLAFTLDEEFGDDDRYNAQKVASNGVTAYLERRQGRCTSARIPFSQTRTMSLEAEYDDAQSCTTLTTALGKLTQAFQKNAAALQTANPSPSNVPPCTLVSTAAGTLAEDEKVGPSPYSGGCSWLKLDPDASEYVPERYRYKEKIEVDLTSTTRPEPVKATPDTRDDEPRCRLTGPGWVITDLPKSFDGRPSQTEVEVSGLGSCAEITAFYNKFIAASKSVKPTKPAISTQARFWYTSQEPDRAVTGSCESVSQAAEDKCAPYTETEVPEGGSAVLKAGGINPDVTCAAAQEMVTKKYPNLTQISTVDTTRAKQCVFSEPAKLREVRVELDAEGSIYSKSATTQGELKVAVEESSSIRLTDASSAKVTKGDTRGLVSVSVGSRTVLESVSERNATAKQANAEAAKALAIELGNALLLD